MNGCIMRERTKGGRANVQPGGGVESDFQLRGNHTETSPLPFNFTNKVVL